MWSWLFARRPAIPMAKVPGTDIFLPDTSPAAQAGYDAAMRRWSAADRRREALWALVGQSRNQLASKSSPAAAAERPATARNVRKQDVRSPATVATLPRGGAAERSAPSRDAATARRLAHHLATHSDRPPSIEARLWARRTDGLHEVDGKAALRRLVAAGVLVKPGAGGCRLRFVEGWEERLQALR